MLCALHAAASMGLLANVSTVELRLSCCQAGRCLCSSLWRRLAAAIEKHVCPGLQQHCCQTRLLPAGSLRLSFALVAQSQPAMHTAACSCATLK